MAAAASLQMAREVQSEVEKVRQSFDQLWLSRFVTHPTSMIAQKQHPKHSVNSLLKGVKSEKWQRAMPPNHTHEIVHSAMYHQNLIVIHESSKKFDQKCIFFFYT